MYFVDFFNTFVDLNLKKPMLLTITLVLSGLLILNLFLLMFSCNKTSKVAKEDKKTLKLHTSLNSSDYEENLAPTGS